MAKRNIPVDLFYASDIGDCTYELNSSFIEIKYLHFSTNDTYNLYVHVNFEYRRPGEQMQIYY